MTGTEPPTPPTLGAPFRSFGPTALVTGAGDRIGRAFSERLASEDFDLILMAQRAEALQEIANLITGRHAIR